MVVNQETGEFPRATKGLFQSNKFKYKEKCRFLLTVVLAQRKSRTFDLPLRGKTLSSKLLFYKTSYSRDVRQCTVSSLHCRKDRTRAEN